MHKLLLVLIFLALLALAYLAYKGHVSRGGNSPGLIAQKLQPCPQKPNCVCSEYPEREAHFIEPFAIESLSAAETLQKLERIATSLGGQIQQRDENYLALTFSSSLFGFVDDVEFRADPAANVVQVRSASRVGRSDLDANRKRIEAIRLELAQN